MIERDAHEDLSGTRTVDANGATVISETAIFCRAKNWRQVISSRATVQDR